MSAKKASVSTSKVCQRGYGPHSKVYCSDKDVCPGTRVAVSAKKFCPGAEVVAPAKELVSTQIVLHRQRKECRYM